jgi:hypothetical protein
LTSIEHLGTSLRIVQCLLASATALRKRKQSLLPASTSPETQALEMPTQDTMHPIGKKRAKRKQEEEKMIENITVTSGGQGIKFETVKTKTNSYFYSYHDDFFYTTCTALKLPSDCRSKPSVSLQVIQLLPTILCHSSNLW